jgi:membrane protease YdiL (CAAX protease family)
MSSSLGTFIVLSFAASVCVGLAAEMTGGSRSPMTVPLGLIAMLSPAFTAWLAARIGRDSIGTIGVRSFPLAYLPVALLAVPVVQHAMNMPVMFFSFGYLPWVPWLSPDSTGMFHPPPEMHLGEVITVASLARGLALKAVLGLLIVSLFAFGEEVGWRGYMQRRIVRQYGIAKGIALTAAIWAVWHLPYSISGLHHIAEVPLYALLVIMPVGHLGLGLFLGWLYQRTSSIWLAAIAHGAANNWGQFAFRLMEGDAANLPLAIGNSTALLTLGVVVVLRGMSRTNLGNRLVSPTTKDQPSSGEQFDPSDPIQ